MGPTLQLIVNVGAICFAVSAVIGVPLAFVKLWPLIKRMVKLGGVVESLPETLEQQNKVMADVAADVKQAVKQVQNSHVTNLREDLDAVRDQVNSLHEKVDALTGGNGPTTTINVNPVGGTP